MHRIYRLSLLSSLVLCTWLATMACPAPIENKACNTISDCPAGQRCVAKLCKDIVDASTPDQTTTKDTSGADETPVVEAKPEAVKEITPEPRPEPTEPEFDPNAPCSPGAKRLCYPGAQDTRGVGTCIYGRMTCLQTKKWTPCIGHKVPEAEVCDGKDNDCDGTNDEDAKCDACSTCDGGKCTVRPDVNPTLTKISPDTITPISQITIELTGDCFADKAEVLFDGKPVATTFVSRTSLEATIPLQGVATGKYEVIVRNPGDKRSKALEFELTKPPCTGLLPRISKLNPAQAEVGKKIAFSIAGSSFQSGDEISFDGKVIATKYGSFSLLSADPTLDLTNVTAGTYKVKIIGANGCDSAEATFYALEAGAVPNITGITPSTLTLDQTYNLVIKGKNFLSGISFFIGLNSVTGLQYISPNELRVTFTPKAADGWSTGTKQAYVINANSKQSNQVPLVFQ